MLLNFARYGCTFFVLSAMILSLLNINPCIAQNDEKVSLDIYYIDEIEACRDKGYQKYDTYKKSNCKPWTINEIDSLEEYKVGSIREMPPGDILLSQELYDDLVLYSGIDKNKVKNRKCILLVFSWKTMQNGFLTLERVVGDNKEIPVYPEPIKENFYGRNYIHHERADAFIPGNNIKWKLSLNGIVWTYSTQNPHEKK